MNVLFHCYEYPPQAGGVGSYLQHMGAALTSLGHRVVTVTSRSPGLPECEETASGLVYRLYDRAGMRSAPVRDAVLAVARDHRVDLIEGADHLGEMAGLLRLRDRPPILVKVHGSNPIRVVQQAQVIHRWQRAMIQLALWRNRGQTASERYSIERADLLQVPSQRLWDELRRQGLRLTDRCAVIPNPIMPVPGELDGEAGAPTILFPSRLEVRKGIQYLPTMLRRIAQEVPGVRLEIAGDDSYARGLGSLRAWLLSRLGEVGPHVHFLGKLDGDAMAKAYGRAWVVILPSRWDNFPMVVLEAMVRERAVVSSPHGGMPEMLAETGCRIALPEAPDFAGQVVAFLKDRDLRRRAGQSARDRALALYGPARVAQQYLAFLRAQGIGAGP